MSASPLHPLQNGAETDITELGDECEAGLLGQPEEEEAALQGPRNGSCCHRYRGGVLNVSLALAAGVMALHLLVLFRPARRGAVKVEVDGPAQLAAELVQEFEMPKGSGVNLGGWLVLEDWFFSGQGGTLVASQGGEKGAQGRCLPPLLKHTAKPWPSEGVLVHQLNASFGPKETIKIFQAHRNAFFTEADVKQIVATGIDTLRLPMTWATFADALAPLSAERYGAHDADVDTALVPDPFYADRVALATFPRSELASFLRLATRHGAKVVLDLHAFPGGAQEGTYNGIWPNRPVFWTEQAKVGNTSVPMAELGRWIVKALIHWVEGLDAEAQKGLKGLTLMNEPAHSNAWTHFAEEQQVLTWLSGAADDFRKSQLPARGLKLYVNLIETAFSEFERSALPWFLKTFSLEERERWAVADVHWYVAWSNGECDGRTVEGGAYSCAAPLEEVTGKLRWCANDASSRLRGLFGQGQVAVTEFSAGTFHKARYACSDSKLLRSFLEETVKAFRSDEIEPFFWTWKMPFGPNFEPGWSLKYLLGLEEDSDRSLACSELPGDILANASLVHF